MRIRTATAAATIALASLVATPAVAAPAVPAATTSARSVFKAALRETWFDNSPRVRASLCRAYRANPSRIVIAIIRPSVEAGYINKYVAAKVTITFLYSQCGSVA